jgi:two-component system, OmpR family, response regulator
LTGVVTPEAEPARILVVDDEENIRYLLDSAFRHFGLTVATADTGQAAVAAAGEFRPDAIVLDVMLPDLDGFEVLRRLRGDGITAPVLFLTARDATADIVKGLTTGGDDYVVKPFSLEELLARLTVLLRRVGRGRAETLRCADLELDDGAHLVTRGGVEIDLSPTEYKLLRYLLVNTGRVLSRAQILDHVWAYDFGGESNIVELYVSYLRKKLDAHGPSLIRTVRGAGYVLRAPT